MAQAAHYYCAPGGTGDFSQANPGGDPNLCSRTVAKTAGDVIHLAAGTYVLGGTQGYNQQIFLQPGVTLVGATDDPADTVIDGAGKYRAFCCYQTAQVRNVTMRNCRTTDQEGSGFGFGGAICAQADNKPAYVVSNCVVDGCSSTYRGGGGSHGIWYDSVVRNCSVTYKGYLQRADGSAADLRSEGSGGGIWAGTLYNCVVTNNYAAFAGGGIAGGGDVLDPCMATDCLIGWNEASIGGGCGVRGGIDPMRCQLSGCEIVGNRTHALAGYGADKGAGSDGCYLTNCVVRGNQATLCGGGLNRGLAVDCRIVGNASLSAVGYDGAGGGGAAHATLVACTVASKQAVAVGGGIYDCGATDCLLEGNSVFDDRTNGVGGGGAFRGQLLRCEVRANRAVFTGAGIYKAFAVDTRVVSNRLTSAATSGSESTGGAGAGASALLRCEVRDNDAGIVFFGGGLRACAVTNCVVAGNRGPYGGGGYACDFVDCLITNNVATTRSGGGVYNGTSRNCVIAYNEALYNVEGNTEWGRGGGICRGHHVGDLVYSNRYVNGAAVTALKGATDVAIVNCTVFENWAPKNVNGFNSGFATNCIIAGHANTDVYNCQALVNCVWQEDMTTHGQTDATLAKAVNCRHGHGLDLGLKTSVSNGVLRCDLASRSICRDAGLLQDWMSGAVDLAGAPRVSGAAPDIGAFEYLALNRGMLLIVK